MTIPLLLVACSSGELDSAGGKDAGGNDAGDRCTGELSSIGRNCPASFDGTEADLPACPTAAAIGFPVDEVEAWQCQDLSIVRFRFILAALGCYYDATSHALVGAESDNDVPCDDGGHFAIKAGRTNSMCLENAPAFMLDCRGDGGAQP